MMTNDPVRDQYATLNEMRFHYREWGSADSPTVLVLHGLNSDSLDWDFLAAPLSSTNRVICLDLRGHGESDWAEDYSWLRYQEDIDALTSSLGIERFAIYGYSVGGAIAYAYAGTNPEKVTRLVVVDNAPERTRSQAPEQAAASRELGSTDSHASVDEAVAIWQRIDPRGDVERIRHSITHNLKPVEGGRWVTRDHNVNRSNSGYAPSTLYQPPVEQRWELLRRITCPTLIIHAQHSEQFDDDVMQRMARTVKNGRYIQIADSGHRVHWDNPTELIRAVLPFLREGTVV
jgi:pimeloyl-ACP methyl ester carboxylesterase